jgi:hypothetical protein
VRRLGARKVRYMYLMPGDAGYAIIKKEIAKRPAAGAFRKASTKRVCMTVGDLQGLLPASPLLKN